MTALRAPKLEVYGLPLPEVRPGTDLAGLIVRRAEELGVGLRDRDVVVVTSKVVLKAEGLMIRLSDVRPSLASRAVALLSGKDPVEVELALAAAEDVVAIVDARRLVGRVLDRVSADRGEALRLLAKVPSLIAVATRQGLVALDGGVDYSNLPPGYAVANVVDFDEEARRLRRRLEELTGSRLAVVVTDTEFNLTGKVGSVDVAVGSSGLKPVTPRFAARDLYGRPKFGGVDVVVDELAAAAALLMGQTSEGVPVVVVRGLSYEESEEGVSEYAAGLRGVPLGTVVRTALAKLVLRLSRLVGGGPGAGWLARALEPGRRTGYIR